MSDIKPLPHQNIKVISGSVTIQVQVTCKWNIEYNYSKVHPIGIKSTIYIPNYPLSILFPQHWSQQENNNFPTRRGTYMENYEFWYVLYWVQRKYQCSIKLYPKTNTGWFYYQQGPISTYYSPPQLIQKSALPSMTRTSSIKPFTSSLQTKKNIVHHLFQNHTNAPNTVKLPLHSIARGGGTRRNLTNWFT